MSFTKQDNKTKTYEEHTFYFKTDDVTENDVMEYWCASDFNEPDEFIGLLLIKGIVMTNSFWYYKDWPEKAKQQTSLAVICNDVFLWGCADAENIEYEEWDTLFEYYTKDPDWGPAMWVITKRRQMPQYPVYRDIQKAGIWDLDKIKNLEPNPTWSKDEA
jgi:hypothetical protein